MKGEMKNEAIAVLYQALGALLDPTDDCECLRSHRNIEARKAIKGLLAKLEARHAPRLPDGVLFFGTVDHFLDLVEGKTEAQDV